MNVRKILPLLLCGVSLTCHAADTETPEETKVKKLDGTSVLGIVEITDDYTIRVKSDTGIQNIPIAQLGEKDFQKYGFKKDRSQDGRFWSERKEAAENSNDDGSAMEINLAQIAIFQPLIEAYEKNNQAKASDSSSEPTDKNTDSFKPLFSKPGVSNVARPFTGFGNTLAPAASAGSTVISTVSGATPVVPAVPAVPSLP